MRNFEIWKPRYIKIHCDSQAAIRALNSREARSSVVLKAMTDLNALAERGCKIVIVWIKAHVNHAGNERADTLAKTGAARGLTVTDLNIPTPKTALIGKVGEAADRLWQDAWLDYPHARQTKLFFEKLGRSKAKCIYSLERRTVTRLVATITGHGPFAYHQSLIEPSLDPRCRFCDIEKQETFYHFMYDCPRFINFRLETCGLHILPRNYDWSVRDLVSFIGHEPIRAIFELVENVGTNESTTISEPVLSSSEEELTDTSGSI